MGRAVTFTADQVEWIKQNLGTMPFAQMARSLGCCTDTLMRKLNKLGLHESEGAKYLPPINFNAAMWTRPCMSCGCKIKRERNLYLCDRCREQSVLYA